jgi:pyrimidine operon attenuation protein/uracil phosphoribosyltransferase
MTANATLILDTKQVMQKIRRIAYQVYEDNATETEVVLAGIYDRGYVFAQLLQAELQAISPLRVHLVRVDLEKFTPVQGEVSLDCETAFLENKSIILLDDVLNTGRTLAHGLHPFLQIPVKKIRVAVIVNRSHTLFPVAADYVGYALSTTIQEHIEVVLEDDRMAVYLS